MIARIAADVVVVVHLAFVVFVVLGGLLAWRNAAFAWLHVPAVVWGAYAELTASICPLTPLENALRRQAGETGYAGGFVEHYLVPVLYPAGLTPATQQWIGAFVIGINAAIYLVAWTRWRARARKTRRTS